MAEARPPDPRSRCGCCHSTNRSWLTATTCQLHSSACMRLGTHVSFLLRGCRHSQSKTAEGRAHESASLPMLALLPRPSRLVRRRPPASPPGSVPLAGRFSVPYLSIAGSVRRSSRVKVHPSRVAVKASQGLPVYPRVIDLKPLAGLSTLPVRLRLSCTPAAAGNVPGEGAWRAAWIVLVLLAEYPAKLTATPPAPAPATTHASSFHQGNRLSIRPHLPGERS